MGTGMTMTHFLMGLRRLALVGLLLIGLGGRTALAAGVVTLLHTPHGGIQPQAAVDAGGVLHLVYFTGSPAHGDLFYVHKKLGRDASFSAPLRVNSHARSAVAIGGIRGAQIAVGRNGRVHVVWNGSDQAPKAPKGPLLYTRLNDAGTAFEPERNLITWSGNLDGGSSLAADAQGHVYAVWHTAEMGRADADDAVFLTRSDDDGRTFRRETQINTQPTGACGCCSLRAFVDHSGTVYILYRTAAQSVHRDTTLLISRDGGTNFRAATLQPWQINACPMSTFSLAEGKAGVLGAWETQDQVYYAALSPATLTASALTAAPGAGQRKYPVIVPSASGETLFAWSDGSGWARGGALAWQVYDAAGRPTAEKGRVAQAVPVWSLPAAVARPDGSFVLIY